MSWYTRFGLKSMDRLQKPAFITHFWLIQSFVLKCRDGPYFKCCLKITASSALPLSHPPSIITNHIRVQHGSRQSIKVSKCLAESSCPLTTLLELSRKTERKINCHVSWLSYCVSLSLFMFVSCCHLFFLHIWNLFLAPSSIYVSCTPNKEVHKKCIVSC